MKKYIYVVLCFIMLFGLTGCGKKVISPDKFMSITKNYKLEVDDISSHFKEVKQIKNAFVAESDDLWKIEYYVFDNNDSAKDMYNKNLEYYNENKASCKSADEKSSKNIDEFTLDDVEYYMYVCRNKNTLIYVYAPSNSKTQVDKVLRALKYKK